MMTVHTHRSAQLAPSLLSGTLLPRMPIATRAGSQTTPTRRLRPCGTQLNTPCASALWMSAGMTPTPLLREALAETPRRACRVVVLPVRGDPAGPGPDGRLFSRATRVTGRGRGWTRLGTHETLQSSMCTCTYTAAPTCDPGWARETCAFSAFDLTVCSHRPMSQHSLSAHVLAGSTVGRKQLVAVPDDA